MDNNRGIDYGAGRFAPDLNQHVGKGKISSLGPQGTVSSERRGTPEGLLRYFPRLFVHIGKNRLQVYFRFFI